MRDDPYDCAEFGMVLIQELNRKCTGENLEKINFKNRGETQKKDFVEKNQC